MKKVTISVPEWMIEEIKDLTAYMENSDFWNQAITWRQVIKKGLAWYRKKGAIKTKGHDNANIQEDNNTIQVPDILNPRTGKPYTREELHQIATTKWTKENDDEPF